jgi:3,4-dihydroxy 2-butanone 4-phosphate synthase/GTP cyclohydrolase II
MEDLQVYAFKYQRAESVASAAAALSADDAAKVLSGGMTLLPSMKHRLIAPTALIDLARLPDLMEFAREHQLKIGTIADLIHYRSQTESIVERVAERSMQTSYGKFHAIAFRDTPSLGAHLALVHGVISADKETLVRVHQPVSILDLLDTEATTHSWNIASAMQAIQRAERGVIVLLNCEESAEQMFAQFNALCQPQPTKPTRTERMDLRTYGIGAQILRQLGVARMKLLANPRKMPSMAGFNLEVTGYQASPEL